MADSATNRSWRDLIQFLLGPVLLTALTLVWFHVQPPHFPHPSQAQSLTIPALAPLLVAGAVGVWLSSRVGLGRNGPGAGVIVALAAGAIAGAGLLFADRSFGISAALAAKLGVKTIHMAFPASVGGYVAGATAVECLYRLAPIPIVLGLLWLVRVRGKAQIAAFWILALLTSALEPLSQGALFRDRLDILYPLFAGLFLINLFEAWLFRRWGWSTPWLFRLALYGIWHVAGPLVAGLA
jgi:hypothetical protein